MRLEEGIGSRLFVSVAQLYLVNNGVALFAPFDFVRVSLSHSSDAMHYVLGCLRKRS